MPALNTISPISEKFDKPEVVALAEIADRFGISKTSAQKWTARPDFPEPLSELQSGRVWLWADVIAWAKTWEPARRRLRDQA